MKRRLSAILIADVKGYGRLMGDDEVDTIRTLRAYRNVMGLVLNDPPLSDRFEGNPCD